MRSNEILTYCKTCHKEIHCCIFKSESEFAFIGIKDALRIQKLIKKPYPFFIDYSSFSKSLLKRLKNEDPSLEAGVRVNQVDKTGRLMRLKRQKDGRCIFLLKNGKCEIYKVRPNICKIYPYWGIRLLDNKIKLIPHDEKPRCGIIKRFSDKQNIEESISKNEIINLKKIFKNIILEDKNYKKNIESFVENENLIKGLTSDLNETLSHNKK